MTVRVPAPGVTSAHMTQTQPQHQPPSAARTVSGGPGRHGSSVRTHGGSVGDAGRGRRARAPHPAHLPADRGVRVPALHQPGAVAARLRGPAARPGRGRRRAVARAGEVPRHLLRAARRVLPNPRRRAGGPGGRRGPHPLGRRAPTGRAADDDPRPGRGAGAAPGPHLLGPHRAGPRPGGHPPLELVLPRRRRPRPPRRGLPAPDLPGPHAPRRRPRPPLPLHLEPVAQPGGRGAGPGLGRAPHRPGQGPADAAALRRHARRRALRAARAGHRGPPRARCSPG